MAAAFDKEDKKIVAAESYGNRDDYNTDNDDDKNVV